MQERAQHHPATRLQHVLDELINAGAPSALGQYRDDSGTWNCASGAPQLDSRNPMSPIGWFRIGSVTKTFLSALVLQLIGEGKLGLDDTVERWIPGLVPGGHQITLRQLLNHTSGLHNYTDDLPSNAAIIADRFKQWHPRETVAAAVKHAPLFEPGTSRSYSNTGYLILGMVIERATGRPWETELEQRILRPLDLRHTLAPSNAQALPEPHAHGYLPVDGLLIDVTEFNPSCAGAAGGIASTAGDLNRFFRALLTGGLLESAQLQAMQTTVATDIAEVRGGLGLGQWTLPNGLALWGHVGGFFGYHTFSHHTVDSSRQVTISVTSAFSDPPTASNLLTSMFCAE
jgi:D-alanyl-D-alanine carboxypeptidase